MIEDSSDPETGSHPGHGAPDGRKLSPAAERALKEAAERRARQGAQRQAAPPALEHGGRQGPDPVRYGDWEKGGIASDF